MSFFETLRAWPGACVHLLAGCALLAGGAQAADWKPGAKVEFVIGTGPGGALDRTARTVQAIWRERGIVSAPVVVVNKPGAGQAIALRYLDEGTADGSQLSIVSGIIFSNQITGKTRYAYTDFVPVAILFSEATVFAVNAASPMKTGKDLLDLLRRDPHVPSFAVGSTLGSSTHVASALLVKAAGGNVRRMRAVTFKSSGESVTAVLGGHVDVMAVAATLALAQAKAGKLSVLAVASAQRLEGPLADVPTWREQGVDAVVSNWRGVIAHRSTTPEQLAYWSDVFERTVASPEWKREAERSLWEASFATGPAARKFLDQDYAATRSMLGELGLAR